MERGLIEISQPNSKNELVQIRESLADFLYLIKDRFPFSNPEKGNVMDIHDRVMQFMKENELKPSNTLSKRYEQCETTLRLNEFPCYEYLKEKIGMKRHIYNKLKEKYKSKPAFVFMFNPDFEVQTKTEVSEGMKTIKMGFFDKKMVRTIKAC